jgi:hypothetical protein
VGGGVVVVVVSSSAGDEDDDELVLSSFGFGSTDLVTVTPVDGFIDGPCVLVGVAGVILTMPPGPISMPGIVLGVGVAPSRVVPSDRCSTCRDGSPGLDDTNVSHVCLFSEKASGAALLAA